MKNIYKNENSIIFQNKYFDLDTGCLLSPIETQNYTIVQVTESFYNSSFQIERHMQHCDLEITLPLAGELYCATDDIFEKVNNGELYLSFRGDSHALNSRRSCRFRTLAVNFKSGPCQPMSEELLRKFKEKRTFYVPDVSSLLASVVAEFLSLDSPFCANSLDSLITAICVRLTRFGMEPPSLNSLSTEENLPAIINYIDSNFLSIISLEELSARFGYTYSHICKVFKKTYGMTPGDYLHTKKLEYAADLLKKGKNIIEIADLLGYSTPYNFSRAFKNVYGISPGKYRETY